MFPAPQTAEIAAISSFWINMSFNVPYINYSAGFYLYTLSSPSFRRKFIRLMSQITWFQLGIPLNQERHNNHAIPMFTMHVGYTKALDHPTTKI